MSDKSKETRRNSITIAGPYNRLRIIVFLVLLAISIIAIAVRAFSG